MRPNVIEVRQNWLAWMFRADYTSGRWRCIYDLPCDAPYSQVKREIMASNPDYIVDWPEQRGLVWYDA